MSAANSAIRSALDFEPSGGVGLFAAVGGARCGGAGLGDLLGVEAAGADGRGDQGADDALEVHLGRFVVESAGETAGHVMEGAGVKLADGLVVGGGEAELFGDALGLRCGRAEEGGHFERDGPVWGGLGGLSGRLAVRSHGVDPFESAGGR